MKFKKNSIALTLLSSSLFLTGCSSFGTEGESNDLSLEEQINLEEKRTLAHSTDYKKHYLNNIYSKQYRSDITSTPWVYTKSIKRRSVLPTFIANNKVVFKNPEKTNLYILANRLSKAINVSIFVERDVIDAPSGDKSVSKKSSSKAKDIKDAAGTEVEAKKDKISLFKGLKGDIKSSMGGGLTSSMGSKFTTASSNRSSIFGSNAYSFSFEGSVKDMLNRFCEKTHTHWRYDDVKNRIVIYKYISKNFTFAVGTGSSKTSSKLEDKGMGSTFSSSFIPWTDISLNIPKFLTKEGTFSVLESTSSIFVRDTPEAVEAVEKYLNDVNDMFSNQVDIEIKIFSIARNLDDNRGINWNVVFAGTNLSSSLVTPRPAINESVSAILKIPPTASGMFQNFIGSQLFLDNLSTYGKVISQNNLSFSTINNQPVPVKNVSKVSYLKKQTVVADPNGGAPTKSLEPGVIESGVSFSILPSIQKNKKDMLLQISGEITDFSEIKSFDGGDGNIIQLPTINSKRIMNKIWIKSGETLVLSGIDFIKASSTKKGFFSADFWKFGGSRALSSKKETLIIVITPKIKKINLESNIAY